MKELAGFSVELLGVWGWDKEEVEMLPRLLIWVIALIVELVTVLGKCRRKRLVSRDDQFKFGQVEVEMPCLRWHV